MSELGAVSVYETNKLGAGACYVGLLLRVIIGLSSSSEPPKSSPPLGFYCVWGGGGGRGLDCLGGGWVYLTMGLISSSEPPKSNTFLLGLPVILGRFEGGFITSFSLIYIFLFWTAKGFSSSSSGKMIDDLLLFVKLVVGTVNSL